ncbi:hypothetical protein [Actinomyces sp.]|uniref:hypothetical protein n=1 Tax=Actinomyces sp. TaxID=29317 RepID=UPI0026DBFC75|nr:hypothetical protein [Actinomyces sp.]MDO4900929.1 hypothetical protein [Actinomyces sp.]
MTYETVDVGGYQWVVTQEPDVTPYAALTIAYGMLNEPVGELGTLDHLARMLREHLNSPFPAADGSQVHTTVGVYARDASLLIRVEDDRPEVLRAAWMRVAACFERPQLPVLEPQREFDHVWDEDTALRTGPNAQSMNWVRGICPDAADHAQALLHHLAPAAGNRHCVMSTSERSLVGTGFTVPPARPTAPQAVSPLDLDPLADPRNREGQLIVDQIYREVMSVVAPLSPDGYAAFHMLTGVVQRAFSSVAPGVEPEFNLRVLGRNMLLTVFTDRPEMPSIDTRYEIAQRLAAPQATPSDDALQAACAHAERWAAADGYVTDCLLHGVAVVQAPTVAGARYAYDMLLRTRHLAVERARTPLPGLEILRGPLPMPRGRRWRTWFAQENDPLVDSACAEVVFGEHVIAGRCRVPEPAPLEPHAVDAHDLVVCTDDGHGRIQLVDGLNRHMIMVTDVYRGSKALRRKLDEVTAGLPRLRRIYDEQIWEQRDDLIARARKARRSAVVGCIIGVIGIVAVLIYGGLRLLSALGPERVNAPLGQIVELSNGAEVTVWESQSLDSDVAYAVRYCAPLQGGEDTYAPAAEDFTVARSGSGQAEPHTFVFYDSQNSGALAPGECTSGELAVPAAEAADDRTITYTDEKGNRVTWEQS